ncbi:hypothetical protein LEN26_009299 [Aphanomyces euteiches]|nr:hypothetical protein LEN26_009299 [Aphanomyces euteiches]
MFSGDCVVLLPRSAFGQFDSSNMPAAHPMKLYFRNKRVNRRMQFFVKQANVPDGHCYMPDWIMANLHLAEGDVVNIKLTPWSKPNCGPHATRTCSSDANIDSADEEPVDASSPHEQATRECQLDKLQAQLEKLYTENVKDLQEKVEILENSKANTANEMVELRTEIASLKREATNVAAMHKKQIEVLTAELKAANAQIGTLDEALRHLKETTVKALDDQLKSVHEGVQVYQEYMDDGHTAINGHAIEQQ